MQMERPLLHSKDGWLMKIERMQVIIEVLLVVVKDITSTSEISMAVVLIQTLHITL